MGLRDRPPPPQSDPKCLIFTNVQFYGEKTNDEMGEKRTTHEIIHTYELLVENSAWLRSLGRYGRKREDNITKRIKRKGYEGLTCT